VHYTSGLGALGSLAGAGYVASCAGASTLARWLLEASGALFGLYLVVVLVVTLTGWRMRRSAHASRLFAKHAK
jgi:hypothetical protein